jgi:CheY-like chemotaxis protein
MTNVSYTNNVGSSCTALVHTSSSDKWLILIVEDHEDTRFLLRTLLERRGMRVVEAEDGEEGVRAAVELRPDLILMDGSLPRMDGLAATRLVRERIRSDHIPIVFLSGHAAPESRAAAFAAGCCEYLVKPLDFDQLDRVLRWALLLHLRGATAKREHVSKRGLL